MGKERLPASAQRISTSRSRERGNNRGGVEGGGEGTAAIQGRGQSRGSGCVVVDVGGTETGDAGADATGWDVPHSTATTARATTITTTSEPSRTKSTRINTRTEFTFADTRSARGEEKEAGPAYLGDQGLDSGFKASWTFQQEQLENKSPGHQYETSTSTSDAASSQILIRPLNPSQDAPQTPQPPQLPRQSPDPHPQPQRYVLKFDRRLLERSQAREREQRKVIEELLQRQRDEAICVSELVRERDCEIMPSLEGALSLRSGRARGGCAGGENERDRERGRGRGRLVNGIGAGERDTKVNGTMGVQRVGRNGRRARDNKENKVNGNGNANAPNGIHEEDLRDTIAIPLEPSKPSKPKKMELELRIDDKSKDKDKEALERNINNVIFGEVTFKAWYPSWYPKEIIGEKALAGDKGGIVVNELYVCQRCFGYGKVLVEWVKHCRCCEREVPGRKIYVHGGWREDDSPRPAVGEWSIWEVDGGVETIFCQNLSLFAKLFLDNKSVFFDVSGFNYFLLVYTPPFNSPHNTSSTPQKQIVGFFSKEKLSWDNNNLACILIFPPWQRKGLGALLMGISYSIARREQILGGPEKPISELGRKGYKRFWGAEIARWILERQERRMKGKKGRGKREEVGIKLLSEETWIAQEDCLAVLRDMGVVERMGGRGRVSGGDVDGEAGAAERNGKGVVKVRIDKEAVRRWCERERIKLERVVGEEGFIPGYAEKVEEDGEEEGGEEEEEEGEGEVDEEGDEEMDG
ncbi:hypothetical protein ONS95_014153 [Cadophora gregata]|uniref:uncharacterized protein n=1 Tax=Cadophora gregata TaxID=51156 RepID=UPI0026DB9FC2|nr:uncharacterized protein ONS95_014153 [Cadophora gregata]KAK0114668.1 hypothetical protein ONS95_014153 [Cadophora gregata]